MMAIGIETESGRCVVMEKSTDIPDAWIILPLHFDTVEEARRCVQAFKDAEQRLRQDMEGQRP